MSSTKQELARQIFKGAFDLVKALGLRPKLEFGCALKEVNNPSERDFVFIEDEEPIQSEEGYRLYYLDDGEERIPIVTNRPDSIRSNMSDQDHGGMDWDVWCHVLDEGEIKQVKGEHDLPADLMNVTPFSGGDEDIGLFTCREFCQMMEDGVIVIEEL